VAPLSSTQARAWSGRIWPVSRGTPVPKLYPEFSQEERSQLTQWMKLAWKMALEAKERGDVCMGAVLVDPRNSRCVGAAGSETRTSGSNIKHAVMVAISRVGEAIISARQQQQQLNSSSSSPIQQHQQHQESIFIDEPSSSFITSSSSNNNNDNEEDNTNSSQIKRLRMENSPSPSNSTNSSSNETRELLASTSTYLCTSFDAFITHEPCAMCSMALLHSRVRRVFWDIPDEQRGALGSVIRLHALPNVNHRYRVFRGFFPEARPSTTT
jgi:tRNA(Arg) A34 adenosine deaminase TadA